MNNLEKILNKAIKKNANQKQFVSTLNKIVPTLAPVIDKHPEFAVCGAIDDLIYPDRILEFEVHWTDDDGNEQINHAYRVQSSKVLGPYKGGMRFHPTVNADILKSLALEQILKNSLTTLELGGAKGGSDFDPKGKSDAEVQRFCAALIDQLDPYIGAEIDSPAGDIGVGAREIKAFGEEFLRMHPDKKIADAITGKAVENGGSLCRTQATGYGLVYFLEDYLRDQKNTTLQGKRVLISGSGNVATYAAEKAQQLGATVVTVSDSSGYVYDSNGIDIDTLKQVKEVERGRVSDYAERVSTAEFVAGKRSWDATSKAAADADTAKDAQDVELIALPCATQNEIEAADAKQLVEGGVTLVAEGSNLSTTADAIKILRDAGVVYFPGKASNAGGVAVSGLEMLQNKAGEQWTFEQVDTRLKQIMQNIYDNLQSANCEFELDGDYLAAANIAGFLRLAKAML